MLCGNDYLEGLKNLGVTLPDGERKPTRWTKSLNAESPSAPAGCLLHRLLPHHNHFMVE
jgi:hypothetical protein